MADAVHVRRDHEQAQNPVHRAPQVDVGVAEQCGGVQDHHEQQPRDGGRAEGGDEASLTPTGIRISTG